MKPTKAAQRAQAKMEYDVFLAACPSRQLLDRISDKWVVLILCALGGDAADKGRTAGASGQPDAPATAQVMRYSELSRLLAGVSQKMLTQTLRALERDGLVIRTVKPTVPVTVTYELTDLGLSLHRLTRDLTRWAHSHMDQVLANREEHDARAS
ncbi:helix-turn-helix domain-containing protein [Herbidospora sp. NBRC 101105]|uniref:winged helix-turn-helix transcriptional regulator n=1 Tax=Herbidospora sp. NBRC 101105 TaxID=3032195 RepID=UPI0024A4E350|nr:helix-turn-helix domain-containing protein [Herbidospora sp. NBRC 101105]GLX99451.1 transcriptional regulator [Herbidospora sp. NBRC 101105]